VSDSPIGVVTFTALGREWRLKYGHRQRFAAEQLFGCGFLGCVLKVFPGVPSEAILGGNAAAIDAHISIENMGIGALAMLFACGLIDDPDEEQVDAIAEELGWARVLELVMAGINGGTPVAREKAPGEDARGKAPPKRKPTRKR